MTRFCAKRIEKGRRGAACVGAVAMAAIALCAGFATPATADDEGQAPELYEMPLMQPGGGSYIDLQRTKAAVVVATRDAEGNVKVECRDSLPETEEDAQ